MRSGPATAFNIVTQSSMVRVKMPGTSIEFTNGMRPYRETRPYVGFSPTTPQYDAGFRTDPPVSDPSALFNTNKERFYTTYLVQLRVIGELVLPIAKA